MTSARDASTGDVGAAALVTDVVPVGGGKWRATCECGLSETVDDQSAAWAWVIEHPCADSSEG